ncbi:MAG: alpha/beta hydrolase-fold protein [Woeseiaceae bacterium]|nr:alpha/beta hydrolase-fold protein [Woeseiaceae bacterium]
MKKDVERWYSPRLEQDMTVVRWGHYGTPVLLFPTAGGDAEEVERFHLIGALAPLIDDGRIKVYSTDSVAGRAWMSGQHAPDFCSLLQNRFDDFIYSEVAPAIRSDCNSNDIEIITTGASIGAFNAVATVCRHPDAFRLAIAMSGTFDLSRWLHGQPMNEDFYFSSPIHYLPNLEGPQLDQLRTRFIVMPTGEGKYENIGESWRLAHVLGSKGIPNRVDSWGPGWDHDWETWREMLPKYLHEFA